MYRLAASRDRMHSRTCICGLSVARRPCASDTRMVAYITTVADMMAV